ncbi:hypothetical protein [Photorhabdus sp. SF281]|uniref:hypothetical protein n=1 Tax=Photorhabdus sp. SF281 TaxID=3459527 RepID=UPI004044138F
MNAAILKVRVPEELKNAVARAAQDNSLDMSSFVRLVLTRTTKERYIPNATTQAAIHIMESRIF